MRIQKWLSSLGITSRREAEKWISEGRLTVNGKVVHDLGRKIDPEVDKISLDGKLLKNKQPPKVYWALNKPDYVLTSRASQTPDRDTIYDLPALKKCPFLLSPVGRLDYRTEGLLLLTNDGELSYRLCRPQYKVPRTYHAMVSGELSDDDEKKLRLGKVTLPGGPLEGAKIKYLRKQAVGKKWFYWYQITVFEGRNRLVRRLFEHFGLETKRLIRLQFGGVSIGNELPPGQYRQLHSDEIKALKSLVGLGRKEEK